MMNDMARWRSDLAAPVRGSGVRSGMAGLVGGLVMVLAIAAASLIAVVFAATLAVVIVLATALTALTALALRARPRPQAAVSMRRAGHAWVTYGWDRHVR